MPSSVLASGPGVGPGLHRRQVLAGAGGLLLAGCTVPLATPPPAFQLPPQPPPGPVLPEQPVEILGGGAVLIALMVPLSAPDPGTAALARALRNAAELALRDFVNPDIRIAVFDTGGTDAAALAAVETALALVLDGARVELILGPLGAAAVQVVGPRARAANVPVMAFSTDVNVASPGVYLLGFLLDDEIDAVISAAAQEGRRRVGSLIPNNAFGNLAQAALIQAAGRHGITVGEMRRFTPGDAAGIAAGAAQLAANAAQLDSIFLPEGASAPAAAAALIQAGVDPAFIRFLGTGQWNSQAVTQAAATSGGWFPSAPLDGLAAFTAAYAAAFGAQPPGPVAALAYDGALLAASLTRAAGILRFDTTVLTNVDGFLSRVTGLFRFLFSGTNDRGFAVYEIAGGAPFVVSDAPLDFVGA